jgi:tRNA (Thr-GGU) A37 N-methylase
MCESMTRVRVHNLEAVDGTPIMDLKPVLGRDGNPVHERKLRFNDDLEQPV